MEIGQLYWSTGLNTSGLKKGASKAQGIIGGMGKGMAGAMGAATLGVAAVGAAAVKIGKDAFEFSNSFGSAMLEVKTISAAAQQDFDGLSDKILELSTLPIKDDAVGLSQAMYQIVSAGHDGADGLKVLEVAAKAATGGVTDTMTAADGLTTVMNAWGKGAADVEQISDLMFTTVKLGKTTMGELSSSISQVAPLASSMGVSMEEVFAATASITKQGVPTAQAMTQIRSALTSLNDVLGDGWSKTMTFQEALGKVREMSGGSQVELKNMMGRMEGVNAVLALTGDKAAGTADDLAAMGDSAGAAADAFAIMSESTDVKLQQASNNWKKAIKGIGDQLVLATDGLADFFNTAMTGTDALGDNFEGIGESVDSFSDRMKVMKSEGSNFVSALFGAVTKSNESIQKVVDEEKAEAQSTKDNIKAIQDEYARLQETGASDEQLANFKANLTERYKAIQEATAKEAAAAKEAADKAKTVSMWTLGAVGSTEAGKRGQLAKDLKDDFDAVNDIVAAVEGLGVIAETPTPLEIDKTPAIKTIADLEKELKELQETSGTLGNPKEEARNLELIADKRAEIDAAWMEVRIAQHGKLGEIDKLETERLKTVSATVKEIKGELVPMKKVTEEEEKQRDAILAQQDAEAKREIRQEQLIENLTLMSNIMYDSADIFGALADTAGAFDENLGDALNNMANMAGQSAQLVANLASQNYVGALTSALGLVTQIVTMQKDQEQANYEAAERYNNLLKERIDLLVTAGLISEQEADILKLDQLERDLKATKELFNLYSVGFEDLFDRENDFKYISVGTLMDYFFGENWGVDELNEFNDNLADYLKKYSEQFEDLGDGKFYRTEAFQSDFNYLLELQSQINELTGAADNFAEAIDISGALTDSVVDGLLNGFKLAEDGLGDFADTFGEMMQDAGTQYLKKLFEDKYLIDLMNNFAALMEGGLTEEEINQFKTDYQNAINEFQEYTEEWTKISDELGIGNDSIDDSGTSIGNAVKGITEETAGLLEGQFNALRINTVSIIDIMNQNTLIFEDIRDNTDETNSLLRSTNTLLSNLNVSNNESFVK